MNFLSPFSLLLFIPLGAAIVLLYLLKLKRKERMVSSVMLWRDALADIQANVPFQKLKRNLLLILQLVALLLLVAAAARPFIRTQGLTHNRIVLILDPSASMQSTDVTPSRFEQAKSIAIDTVERMGPGDTMLVITAGAQARAVASFTADKRLLRKVISKLQPTDTGCNMKQAVILALSLISGKHATPPRIAILSDGGFARLTDIRVENAKLDFVRLGKQCNNVAITALDSRKTVAGDQQVFVGLRNFSQQERKFNLELYLNDQLLDIREEKLGAGEAKQEILKDIGHLGGRVTARLDLQDDLAADDSGSVYLTKARDINVLLVTKGNIFLQNALNLDRRTRVTRSELTPEDLDARGYDLVVFDQVAAPTSLPPGSYLLVDVYPGTAPAEKGSTATRPSIIDSAANHPVSAYVGFSDIRIAKAHYLKPRTWATTIAEGEHGALAVAGSKDGRRFVQTSFSLLESDFPLRVGFPIFVANCIAWLVPPARSGDSISTGQPMYIDVPPEVDRITVRNPDGRQRVLKVTQTPVAYDDTEQAGIYQVNVGGTSREFACNLLSAKESDTTPREAVMIGGKDLAATDKSVQTNRELYSLLILVALGVLTLEWYAYHRRL